MGNTIFIGRKAAGVRVGVGSLNRTRLQNGMPGYAERRNMVASAVTAEYLASVLEKSTRGDLTLLHEIYDKMQLDVQVGGLADQMKRTLAGADINPEERTGFNAQERSLAKDYYDFVCLLNEQVDTRTLIKEFTDGYMRGVKAFQMQYRIGVYGGKKFAIPSTIKPIAGQRYLWDNKMTSATFGDLRIITTQEGEGIPLSTLPQGKVFAISDGHGMGRWDLLGVYRRALSFWLLKMYAVSWWGDKVEMYGEPIRVARVPQGTRDDTKEEVEAFLAAMGRTAYAVLPDNVNLQMVEAASASNGGLSPHGELLRYLDDRIAFTFLGQADSSTNTSHGSRARSSELQNVSWNVLSDYAAGIGKGFEAFARAAIIQNYGTVVEHLVPRQKMIIKNPSLAMQNATRLTTLSSSGIPVSMKDMYTQVGAAHPQEGDLVFINGTYMPFNPNESPSQSNVQEQEGNSEQGAGREGGNGDDSQNNQREDS